jgi:hypothetical protein
MVSLVWDCLLDGGRGFDRDGLAGLDHLRDLAGLVVDLTPGFIDQANQLVPGFRRLNNSGLWREFAERGYQLFK